MGNVRNYSGFFRDMYIIHITINVNVYMLYIYIYGHMYTGSKVQGYNGKSNATTEFNRKLGLSGGYMGLTGVVINIMVPGSLFGA